MMENGVCEVAGRLAHAVLQPLSTTIDVHKKISFEIVLFV